MIETFHKTIKESIFKKRKVLIIDKMLKMSKKETD